MGQERIFEHTLEVGSTELKVGEMPAIARCIVDE